MKIKEQVGHQGDTQWFSIIEIPKEAKKINKKFIAESEQSGSVHVLCGNYDLFETENGFFVDVMDDCRINHTLKTNIQNKSIDTNIELPQKDHRSSILKKGKYFVGIQRRYDPFQKVWKNVSD
jgi:hypothetical protein